MIITQVESISVSISKNKKTNLQEVEEVALASSIFTQSGHFRGLAGGKRFKF